MGWHILNFDNEIKVNLAKPTGRYHIKSYLKRNVTLYIIKHDFYTTAAKQHI